MPRIAAIFTSTLSLLALGTSSFGDESADAAEIMANPPAEKADAKVSPESDDKSEGNVEVTVGTKLYDAAMVGDLFKAYDQENKRRAAELAPHLNSDALDVIELGPVHSQAYDMKNFNELSERIDPQPRRRLARLAELDPSAAAELRVSMRSEERFFAGEHDAGYDANAGRTANVDFRKMGPAIADALDRAKKATRSKKVTDDQQEVKTGEE